MAAKVSIGTAWSEAAAFLRKERRLLAPVVLGLILLPAVVSTMVQPPVPAGQSPEPGPWMIVAFAMILLMLLGQMAVVLLANGWRGSVGEAIGGAARRLPTLVLAGLMVVVPMILIFSTALAGLAIATGGDGRFMPASVSPGGWLLLLLLAVAGLFFAVRLLPLVVVVAKGSDGPVTALRRTFGLTAGQFWRLFGFVAVIAIAFLVAAAAVGAVFGSMVMLAFGRPEPWSVSLLLIALAGGVVQAALITIYTAMLARIVVQLEGSIKGS